jgi:hypothetical protein
MSFHFVSLQFRTVRHGRTSSNFGATRERRQPTINFKKSKADVNRRQGTGIGVYAESREAS